MDSYITLVYFSLLLPSTSRCCCCCCLSTFLCCCLSTFLCCCLSASLCCCLSTFLCCLSTSQIKHKSCHYLTICHPPTPSPNVTQINQPINSHRINYQLTRSTNQQLKTRVPFFTAPFSAHSMPV